jgi:hypothetical protein
LPAKRSSESRANQQELTPNFSCFSCAFHHVAHQSPWCPREADDWHFVFHLRGKIGKTMQKQYIALTYHTTNAKLSSVMEMLKF